MVEETTRKLESKSSSCLGSGPGELGERGCDGETCSVDAD